MRTRFTGTLGAPLVATLGAMLLTGLPGLAAAQGTLVWARGMDTDSLDPHRTTTAESWMTFDLIYDSLLQFGPDGTPLDAHDVKYTVDRVFDPGNPSATQAGWGPVTELKVVDDLTVTYVLSKPFGAFLPFQAQAFAGIICDSNEELGDQFGSSAAIGSGPFMIEQWVKGDRIVLVPNPHYVNYGRPEENPGPPHLDRMVIRRMPEGQTRLAALNTGEVHIATPPIEEVQSVQESPELDLMVAQDTGQSIFFQFTISRPPFDDERARKAVAYAIDPDMAIDLVFEGLVERETCAVARGVYGNDREWCASIGYSYDPDKATELLAELGYGPDNPMEVVLMTWIDDNREKIAQVFQNQLSQVGINTTLQTMDIGTLNARVRQENEITEGPGSFNMMGWQWYDPDILYYLWHSPGAYAGYQSEELDALLDKTRTTLDPEKRLEFVRQAQEYLLTKAIQVPLYSPGWMWLYAVRNEVEGFKVGPFNRPLFNDVRVVQ
jgi:peptide/nickel transport system substrate-binding protein